MQAMHATRCAVAALLLPLAAPAVLADGPALDSHEVNADRSVTFRYYGPLAKSVAVSLDYSRVPIELARGIDGVWAATTAPLAPELHFYGLVVDGRPVFDPENRQVDPNLFYRTNEVWVPGAPQPWTLGDVAHGVVHHHAYRTREIAGLPADTEDYYVYTPPGYDPSATRRYPVLYLLHGWSSLADSWVHEGQLDTILDNLLAQGRVEPMVVVMPLGYGDMTFVTGGFGQWNDESKVLNNLRRFERALVGEILPRVEREYRVSAAPGGRAIAGLSMGGGESLLIGLGHPELFGWVGGFSSATNEHPGQALPALSASRAPRLLWIACGTGDELIAPNRAFVAWLRTKGLSPVAVETPGIHNWPVWRADLVAFAPLLFRP